jgi:hypothetical protein
MTKMDLVVAATALIRTLFARPETVCTDAVKPSPVQASSCHFKTGVLDQQLGELNEVGLMS